MGQTNQLITVQYVLVEDMRLLGSRQWTFLLMVQRQHEFSVHSDLPCYQVPLGNAQQLRNMLHTLYACMTEGQPQVQGIPIFQMQPLGSMSNLCSRERHFFFFNSGEKNNLSFTALERSSISSLPNKPINDLNVSIQKTFGTTRDPFVICLSIHGQCSLTFIIVQICSSEGK